MAMWKKILLVSFVFVVLLGKGNARIVYADSYGIDPTVKATGGLLPTSIGGASTVPQFIGVVIRTVLSLLAIVFFLLIFYAGIVWMTARGNQTAVDKSKSMMEAAVIGLIIVMASYAISRFVFQGLTTGNTNIGTGGGSGATMGCCIGTEDKTICSANVRSGSCSDKATWSAGNCPDTCVVK